MVSRLQLNDVWLLVKRRSRVWLTNAEDMGAAENREVKTLFVLIASFALLVVSGILTHACLSFTFSALMVVLSSASCLSRPSHDLSRSESTSALRPSCHRFLVLILQYPSLVCCSMIFFISSTLTSISSKSFRQRVFCSRRKSVSWLSIRWTFCKISSIDPSRVDE
jgi:uncharacterized membrane protein YhaH (DUF805 family)